MPKLIHISDEAAHKLDVIRDRRNCSFTEAVMYLVDRADPRIDAIARIMHYPRCWDTAAYPTLESAIKETFTCAEHEDAKREAVEDRRKKQERAYDAQREQGAAR